MTWYARDCFYGKKMLVVAEITFPFSIGNQNKIRFYNELGGWNQIMNYNHKRQEKKW